MRKMILLGAISLSPMLINAQADKNANAGVKAPVKVAESTEATPENHIDVIQKQETWDKEVKFKATSGKVTKTIRTERKVKKNGDKWRAEGFELKETAKQDFVLIDRYSVDYDYDVSTSYGLAPTFGRDTSSRGEYWDKEIEVLNNKGETVFKKQFRTWPGEHLTFFSYWESRFSRDGRTFLVYYRDEKGGGNVDVYDVSGKLLAHSRAERDIENLEISHDGSLVAGYIVMYGQEDEPKYIFLLDAKSGQSKLAKAKGVIGGKEWDAEFALSTQIPTPQGYKNLPPSTVTIFLSSRDKRSEKDLGFESIPVDLMSLVPQGKAK